MKRKLLLIFCSCQALALTAAAQIGGHRGFEYLNLPTHAKLAGLGGYNVSSQDHDVNMVQANPGLLNEQMDRRLSLSYVNYLADIGQTTLNYGFNTEKAGRYAVGLSYLNYGDFTQRDAAGNEEGTFAVNDFVLGVTRSSQIENYTLGVTAKMAVSSMAGQKAVGLLADVGGVFKHPEKELYIGLVLKNMGYQVKKYDTQAERQPMPFDAQLGLSYKLEHMPLRFSVTAHHLYQFDIVYLDPTKKGKLNENNEEVKEKKTFADKVARHFVFGGEFLLSKNFNVRVGYNHLRRRELRMETQSGGAGFSLGAMLRIRSFQLDYSRAMYHVAGGSNYFTLTTDLNTILKGKVATAAAF